MTVAEQKAEALAQILPSSGVSFNVANDLASNSIFTSLIMAVVKMLFNCTQSSQAALDRAKQPLKLLDRMRLRGEVRRQLGANTNFNQHLRAIGNGLITLGRTVTVQELEAIRDGR